VESYLLLEPDACAVTDGKREVETVVCGGIVQMKQNRIIPVPDHDRGRPMEVNACILTTHTVYL
jgi:hypothetical protein